MHKILKDYVIWVRVVFIEQRSGQIYFSLVFKSSIASEQDFREILIYD